MQKEKKEVATYVVLVDESYLRDQQVFNPEKGHFPDIESSNQEDAMDNDDNWKDCFYPGFVGIYKWAKGETEQLLDYVSAKAKLNRNVLYAVNTEN